VLFTHHRTLTDTTLAPPIRVDGEEDVRAVLDGLMNEVRDVAGVFVTWPLLAELARTALARLGPSARRIFLDHPIAALSRQDPFTRWTFDKPRGYAGDARLVDYIYGDDSVAAEIAEATPFGRDIYCCMTEAGGPVAVRERRRLLARLVDTTVERLRRPKILTIAAGHLREAGLATHAAEVPRWVALDHDAESVREIERCHGRLPGLLPLVAPVGRMIVRPTVYGRFDLIYAPGLYDYLDERTARRLTAACFSILEPGGTFLFSNTAMDLPEAGYMDVFMDWRLNQRTEQQVRDLVATVPETERGRTSIFRSSNGVLLYVLMQRA
jgi:hypothetical protein